MKRLKGDAEGQVTVDAPPDRTDPDCAQGRAEPVAAELASDLGQSDGHTWVDDERARAGAVGGLGTGSRVGRYVLRRRLGAGAMGVVFEAHDPDLDRRLAIKVLRVRGHDARRRAVARARLIREAQALARVDHPNVVAVHDVGRHDRGVYVVMEYVDGRTLSTWREETNPGRARLLRAFIEAGRGLAAAHAAGVVHRDFKPENVMIELSGRSKVLDFGLARARNESAFELSDDAHAPAHDDATSTGGTTDRHPPASTSASDDGRGSLADSSRLSDRLTRDGAILGTPAYMSPEQHLGEPVDAASDQFSFCIALYEALYGDPPFKGKTLATRSVQVVQGRISDAPRGADVPKRVRRILLRGLSVDPNDRFPSMDALLDELERDPASMRRRRILWSAAAAGLGALAVGAGLYGAAAGQRCEAAAVPGWSAERREALESSLAAVQAPFAAETAERTVATLDEYAGAWASMREDACRATHERNEQSAELLDLRMACLDARAHTFDVLVTRLDDADPELASHAVSAALHLPALGDCSDASALRARDRGGRTPAARDKHRQIRRALDDAKVEYELGRYEAALEATTELLERAADTDDPHLGAEVGLRHAQALEANGQAELAEAALLDAATAAERADDPMLLGKIRSLLVAVVGDRLARPAEGRIWARFARNSFEIAGADDRQLAPLDHRLGFAAEHERKLEEQAELQRSALQRYGALDDADPTVLAAMYKDVAGVLADLGRHEQAERHAVEAETLWRERLGPHHPKTIVAIGMRGLLADMRGDYDEAGRLLAGAEARLEQALGTRHPQVATIAENLAINLAHRGELEAAEEKFRKVVEIERARYGLEHPQTISALSNLASILRMREDATGALAVNEEILQAVADNPDATEASRKNAYAGLARSYYDLGRFDDAVDPYLAALEYEEQFYGVGRPGTAVALANVVDCMLMAGRGADAWRHAERLARLDEEHELEPDVEAYAKIMVARALLVRRKSGDRSRARALLISARAALGDLPARLERGLIEQTAKAEGWSL